MSITELNIELEPEILTDKSPTKTIPCRKCGRGCIVTLFATPAKTECWTCRGKTDLKKHRDVQIKQAHTADPATLKDLRDALINPEFREVPWCPFSPDHHVELKSICHSPSYGPRKMIEVNAKGVPKWDQKTGESVTYQCNTCKTIISFSTMHPLLLKAQNEPRTSGKRDGPDIWASILGVRDEDDEL